MLAPHTFVWLASLLLGAGACITEARAFVLTDSSSREAESRSEFRTAARALHLKLNPPCPVSSQTDGTAGRARAQAEVDRFRQDIADTPYADAFDAGVNDAVHFLQVIDVACATPPALSDAAFTEQLLRETRDAIAAMRAQMT